MRISAVIPVFLCCATLAATLTGCGNLQNLATKARLKRQQKAMEKLAATSTEEATARLGAKALGEIAYVDDAEQFVLIRTLSGAMITNQAPLETRREGKTTALLRGTTARKNAFTAADLIEGQPQDGDVVFPSTQKAGSAGLSPAASHSAPAPPPASASTAPGMAAPLSSASGAPSAPLAAPLPAAPAGVLQLDPATGLPLHPLPASGGSSGPAFDPANLPPMKDFLTPEDLRR